MVEISLDMSSDFIDPADENWQEMDDAAVWHAAQAGISQAVAELARREHQGVNGGQ